MNPHPDSPFLAMAIALGCGAVAYLCHRLVKAIEANKLLPIHNKMKGDKGRRFPGHAVWPFRDKYQVQFYQRSMLHLQLILMKWMLGFVAIFLGAIYPLIYIYNFAGR